MSCSNVRLIEETLNHHPGSFIKQLFIELLLPEPGQSSGNKTVNERDMIPALIEKLCSNREADNKYTSQPTHITV